MNKRTKGVLVYLTIAFAVTQISFAAELLLGLSPGTRPLRLIRILASFSPAIAAFVVRKWVTGEGFSDAGLAPNLRRKWRYYLFAWFFPCVAMLLVFALVVVSGAELPSLPPAAFVLTWLFVETMIGPLTFIVEAWGEEFGWRGYLQVRLLSDRPVLAALATGLIWGLWHLPLYPTPDDLPRALLVLFVSTTLGSIILGWLRLRTGSVWPAAIYHAAHNIAVGSAIQSVTIDGLVGQGWNWYMASLVVGCLALGAFCAWIVLTGQLREEPVGEQAR